MTSKHLPKFSIITICYNEPNLEKTCKSIVNQTFQGFEWIVIDGGSNRQTLDIFEKYKDRIDYFVSEKDNGRYHAMNKGLRVAKGEYVNFMNAGDYFNGHDVLEKIIHFGLDKDIVYGDWDVIDGGGKVKLWKFPAVIDFEFLYLGALPHQSSFIKRNLFEKYGFYDERFQIASDWEKWLVFILFHHCSYKHINLSCSVFNLNGISTKNIQQNIEERKKILRQYFSEKELKKIRKSIRNYSWLERIFSVKNNSPKTRKIITILGFKIKIKRKKQKN